MNEPIQPDSDRTVSLPPTPADETAQGRTESSHDPSATLGYEAPPGATTDDLAERGPDADGSAAVRKPRRDLPSVPGYEISGVLGRGGMGVVYRARQVRLNRPVALKMVLAGAHAGPDQLARFDQEARAVARLQHPNIVQIYEIGEHDGLPYFSLEFVDGGTLAKHIDGKPRPPREAAEVLLALAKAMGFAHQHHIVHRDLKPANVLLGVGQAASLSVEGGAKDKQGCLSYVPKVTDFGLAKAVEEGGTVQTASGTVMGTPAYMPPEQARGDLKEIGPLCDLYALGAILYDLLTGRPPFQGASMLETLDQVRNREPVPPRLLQPTVPIDLETICSEVPRRSRRSRYTDQRRRTRGGSWPASRCARPVSASSGCGREEGNLEGRPAECGALLFVGLDGGLIWVKPGRCRSRTR
ncbi:MAG: serine/threonine-protein kinase [Gemmataceae bacterium]